MVGRQGSTFPSTAIPSSAELGSGGDAPIARRPEPPIRHRAKDPLISLVGADGELTWPCCVGSSAGRVA